MVPAVASKAVQQGGVQGDLNLRQGKGRGGHAEGMRNGPTHQHACHRLPCCMHHTAALASRAHAAQDAETRTMAGKSSWMSDLQTAGRGFKHGVQEWPVVGCLPRAVPCQHQTRWTCVQAVRDRPATDTLPAQAPTICTFWLCCALCMMGVA